MKTKPLRKVRKKIRLYKRNGLYYVDTGHFAPGGMAEKEALDYRRFWVIRTAKDIFGFKHKHKIK
tara:strand:+ start:316 stop:510 length:195 start_codon:yes stop_codon:yes gene_type:complete